MHDLRWRPHVQLFDSEKLADSAAEFGVDRQQFLQEFNSQKTKAATAADFEFAQSLGATGFPTLLVRDASGYRVATNGYRPLEELVEPLEGWFDSSTVE